MPASKTHPARVPTGPREQDTVKAICQFLSLHRIPNWRMTTGALRADKRFVRFGAVGMADIIGMLPPLGTLLAVEVKSATGRLRPAQEAFLGTVTAAGGKAFVARSVADVQKALGL